MTVDAREAGAALDDVAGLGSFFALPRAAELDGVGRLLPVAGLREAPARASCRAAVDRLAERFGSVDRRPVASLLQLSMAARLTAPLLATAAAHGLVPTLAAEDVRVGFEESGAVRVLLSTPVRADRGEPSQLVRTIARSIATGPLALFTEAVQEHVTLSPRTTRGNVASGLAAAALVLRRERRQDGTGSRAMDLVARLLRTPELAGSGDFLPASPAQDEPRFRRNNCCLFYRVPGAGTCGDCVLVPQT